MMAKIIHAVVFLALILTTSITPISSRSAAKSDLIDGNEFLSLFIEQTNINNKGTHYDDFDSSKSTNLDEEESIKESILTIDSLLSKEDEILEEESSTLYGERLRDQMKNHKYATNLQMHEERTTPSLRMNVKHQEDSDSSKRQVVKFVTSGSKIVFLEEIISRNDSRTNFPSPFNEQKQENSKTNSSSSDIKVISVRVSSTVGRSQNSSNGNPKTDDLVGLTPVETIQDNDSPFDDDSSSAKNDFINRSHKSEFSIEESEPVTQESVSDSVNGESTNIHSILAPPSSINQSPQQNQQQQQQQQQQHHMTAGAGRMQRKQDKLVPFQTVIYHDTHFNKDGSAQPRSVSYSSLAQTIDELNSWKDLDSLLEAKQNVSERLMTKPENFQEHPKDYGEPEKVYSEPSKFYSQPAKMYGEPSKFYSEPSKVYSEPAKIYGQPEKQYGEPSKIYSEPAKVYSEPAKVYSEPAKVYGEPSKVYWPLTTTAQPPTQTTSISPTPTTRNPNSRRIIFNLDKLPYDLLNAPESSKPLLEPDLSGGRGPRPSAPIIPKSHQQKSEPPNSHLHAHSHQRGTAQPTKGAFSNARDLVTERPRFTFPSAITQSPEQIYTPTPEQNYEVEESVSVMTNGRAHGVQPITPTTTPADDAKVGYVVEGRNYRKYRVEEKTPDGFIVGEYGVVSHNDGSLRGVRYTADSNINPSLIHDALMKFLAL